MTNQFTMVHIDADAYGATLLQREMASWSNVKHAGIAQTAALGLGLIKQVRPDIVVVELGFPDMDGFDLIENIASAKPDACIIVFTIFINDYNLYRLKRARVSGIVAKSSSAISELELAIAHYAVGRRYVTPRIAEAARKFCTSPDAFYKILSRRELAIITLLGSGMDDLAIAENVGITAATVHCHRQRIMKKLGVHTRDSLVRWCQRSGFTTPSASHLWAWAATVPMDAAS